MAFSNTLQELRHYLASSVGDLIYGQAGTTGATTTKIYAPFLWQADDYYNEHKYEAYVYLGTNIGETRRATDWVLSSKLLTIHTAYDAACDATSFVELHHIFIVDELDKAINLSIQSLGTDYLIDKIDETITLVADVYEYTVPSGFNYIHKITTEKDTDTGTFRGGYEIDQRAWDLISPRTLKLKYGYYGITAGEDLRIEGQGVQNILTSDTDVCNPPPEWIVQKAITLLPQNKIQSNDLDRTLAVAVTWVERHPIAMRQNPWGRRVIE